MVMVTWQAEGNAGKKTIIVDFKSEEGKKVALDLVKLSDFVLLNKGRVSQKEWQQVEKYIFH